MTSHLRVDDGADRRTAARTVTGGDAGLRMRRRLTSAGLEDGALLVPGQATFAFLMVEARLMTLR
ncbi:hypothetical protein, partial [Geodermatophilus sp. CPCC 205761]|uniref:hypothetical protein n=1 Tax=Geodermatophilus sp. CPCC 205761 TaxID=2936597 RepID=UPI003EEA5871